MSDKILGAYLAGWRDCVDSLKDQSFGTPDCFDAHKRGTAELCYDEDFNPVLQRQRLDDE